MGSGTLAVPYIFYANGIVFGTILLLFGAGISLYAGWLVAICCHKLNAARYEDIAMITFGLKASRITSVCMLFCMMGFIISYVVLVVLIFTC